MSIRVSTLLWVWIGASLGSVTGYLIGTIELNTAITQIIAPGFFLSLAWITEKITK